MVAFLRRAALTVLYITGALQVAFGLLLGRIRVYAQENPFWEAIGKPAERAQAFQHYIDIYKDQWSVVTWLGLATLGATLLLSLTTGKPSPPVVEPSEEEVGE